MYDDIDWALLRAQKADMVRLADGPSRLPRLTESQWLSVCGLVNFLDSFMGRAADELGDVAVYGDDKEEVFV